MKGNIRIDFMAVLSAGVLWGTLSPVGKRLGMLGTDMLTVGVLRAAIMTAGVGLFLALCAPRFFIINRKQICQIALMAGPCMVGIYAGFFFALQYLSVPMTIVLFFIHPLFTTIGSFVITREMPNRFQVAGALLTLTGVAVGVFPQEGSFFSSIHPVGLAWVLFAATGISLYSLFGRLSAQTGFVPQPTLFFYIQVFGLVWLFLIKTLWTGWGNLFLLSGQQVEWILYVGLIGSLLGYSLYFYSLRTIQASTASIASSIEIVTAFALSSIMLGQPPAFREMAGALLIILAIVLVSRETTTPSKP